MNERIPIGNAALAGARAENFRLPWQTIVAVVIFAVGWELLSWISLPYVVPSWSRIFNSLLNLRFDYVLITLARVLAALVTSFVIGVVLAGLMYSWASFEQYARPIVRVFMAVPVVCWIIFGVLWFKALEFRIAFVLIVTCAPIFAVDCLDGMKGVPKELRDMVRSFRPNRIQYLIKLVIPAIMPVIFTSWKINLSLAIRVVTIAELVGAISGIGYGMVIAQQLFSVADVFAWTLVLIIMLFIAEGILIRVEHHVLRWRP